MNRNERGFTLLEILVALFLLGTALALTMKLLATDLRAIAASETSLRAVLLAEERMQELIARGEITPGSWTEAEGNEWVVDVQVANEYPKRMEGLEFRLRKIALTVRRAPGAPAGLRGKAFALTTLQTQAVRTGPEKDRP